MVDEMNELNKRQQTFAEAYAIPGTGMYGNVTQAAIYAGYSKKTAHNQGSRLIKNDEVQKCIQGVQERLFDENIMTGKEVLYRLTETARGKTVEVEPVTIKTADYIKNPDTGKKVLVYNEHLEMVSKPPRIGDRNKALELLGKHHKLFTEKQEVDHSGIEILVDYGDEDEES